MLKKKIKIAGMELFVTFNMATEITFEKLSERPFNLSDIKTQGDNVMLCFAAINSCRDNKEIPDDCFSRIINEAAPEEFTAMVNAVEECIIDFFHIPENVISENEEQKQDTAHSAGTDEEKTEEEQEKN
jgi:hypothetical protein